MILLENAWWYLFLLHIFYFIFIKHWYQYQSGTLFVTIIYFAGLKITLNCIFFRRLGSPLSI